jgi:hypothetical protein
MDTDGSLAAGDRFARRGLARLGPPQMAGKIFARGQTFYAR